MCRDLFLLLCFLYFVLYNALKLVCRNAVYFLKMKLLCLSSPGIGIMMTSMKKIPSIHKPDGLLPTTLPAGNFVVSAATVAAWAVRPAFSLQHKPSPTPQCLSTCEYKMPINHSLNPYLILGRISRKLFLNGQGTLSRIDTTYSAGISQAFGVSWICIEELPIFCPHSLIPFAPVRNMLSFILASFPSSFSENHDVSPFHSHNSWLPNTPYIHLISQTDVNCIQWKSHL